MDQKPTDIPAVSSLEKQIEAWRAHLHRSRTITSQDSAELEDHLREQIASLGADRLSTMKRSWWPSSGWGPWTR